MRIGSLVCALLAGCNEEGVVFVIGTGQPVVVCGDPPELGCVDGMRLSVAAAQPGNRYCTPAVFDVGASFPYAVAIAPGETYDSVAVLRAELLQGVDVVARREALHPFPQGGVVELVVTLDTLCDDCGDEGQCIVDTCADTTLGPIFAESEAFVDLDRPCEVE